MKNRIFKSVISIVLVIAIFFTSNSLLLHVFSSEELPVGVGIYNHVLTSSERGSVRYILKFYQHNMTDGSLRLITFPNEMQISGSKYLTPNHNDGSAYIFLEKDEKIVFSDCEAFVDFFTSKMIDMVEITYDYGTLNGQQTSVLYSNQKQYFSFFKEEPTWSWAIMDYVTTWMPTYLHGENPFETMTDHIAEFVSTPMTTVEVEQSWRDRGLGRPDVDEVQFDLYQDGDPYLDHDDANPVPNMGYYGYTVNDGDVAGGSYTAYLEAESVNSSTYLYQYTVPECAPDGHTYTYTSEQIFPENYEDEYTHENSPQDNEYLAVGLTEFNFTMKWADTYDPAARPVIDAQYIKDNFTLYKKDNDTTTVQKFWPDNISDEEISNYFTITTEGNVTTVQVKRLEEINASGTANEYYLKLNNQNNRLQVNQADVPHRPEFDKQHDYYAVRSENSGLHANETDITYENGEINLILSGSRDFSVNYEWKDDETEEIRKADDEAATFNLWRYTYDINDSAIVGSRSVGGSADTGTVSFGSQQKYDLGGNLYTYYAIESLSVEEKRPVEQETTEPSTVEPGTEAESYIEIPQPYKAFYQGADEKRLLNGETVINRLSDVMDVTVSAQWTAAARQGGTADVTYQLQRRVKGSQDAFVPVTEEVTETVTVDPVTGEEYSAPTEVTWDKPLEINVRFDELHMSRYNDDSCIFEDVDVYDENGVFYEYRVVQTSVTRSDVMTEGDEPTASVPDDTVIGESIGGAVNTDGDTISANDKYAVKVTRENENREADSNGTNFHFDYIIQGDTFIKINKKWVAEDRVTPLDTSDPLYGAEFDVEHFNNYSHGYQNSFIESAEPENGEYPLGYFDDYVTAQGYFTREQISSDPEKYKVVFRTERTELDHSTGWSTVDIPVPKYDEEGREIAYRSVEKSKSYPIRQLCQDGKEHDVGFFSTYAWGVHDYTANNVVTTEYELTVTNIRTYEGGDYAEYSISKEWVDDGELEFRRPVKIVASENVYQNTVRTKTLNKENVWEERIPINIKYERDENNNRIWNAQEGRYEVIGDDPGEEPLTYLYNDADFMEIPDGVSVDQLSSYYWSRAELERITGHSITDDDNNNTGWIYKLLTDRIWHTYDTEDGQTVANSYFTDIREYNHLDLVEQNQVSFDNFAGIYKSAPIDSAGIRNDQHCHYYAVSQEYTPGGVNNVEGTVRFINTRIGVVNYEVLFDWKVGDALNDGTIDSVTVKLTGEGLKDGYIEKVITKNDLARITEGKNAGKDAFYFLNLPKYNSEGKLIEYKIDDILINNKSLDSDGEVVLDSNDRCVVTVSSVTTIEGDTARSDDLYSVVITNRFADEDKISVHKQWVDNSDADKTRSDLYIKLFRVSTNPQNPEPHQVLGDLSEDYKWEQDEDDTLNYWTYTFDELPKYDSMGYPYTYFVKEQEPERLPGYRQEYSPNALYLDLNNNVVKNPKVYIDKSVLEADMLKEYDDDPDTQSNYVNVVFDGGTITNRLYGELTIDGEKLWQNMSSILEKRDYPIATVALYRDFSEMSDEDFAKLVTRAGLTEDEVRDKEVLISTTTVRSGATTFRFTDVEQSALDRGFVIMEDAISPKTDENGSIVLPKYDELGIRLSYKLVEKPINGYISKIEQGSQKLINEHHGGAKVNFSVTKHWEGMENEHVFPDITFTLHQVFSVEDEETHEIRYYEMNHFERKFKATNYADYSVTFGDAAHPEEAQALRYFAPTGEPYTYFVTETLSNYDGEQVIFVESDKAEMIPTFLEPYQSSNSVMLLDSNLSAKALGFTSSITETFGDAADVISASLTPAGEASPDQAQIDEEVESYLNNKDSAPIALDETVTNTYQPDAQNFQGVIEVSKQWDTQNNDDYRQVKAYSFMLSRYTKLTNKESLFRVVTTDSLSGEDALPHFTDVEEGIYMDRTYNGIRAHDFEPSMSDSVVVPPSAGQQPYYYIGVLLKDNKAITVVIDVSDGGHSPGFFNNKVTIKGLAIYGHDALKYYYTVTEDPKVGYTLVKGSDTKHLDQSSSAEVQLINKLNVLDLKVYKSFGREYQDSNDETFIERIPAEDFAQYFNDDYFKQLKFVLYRQSSAETAAPYKTVTGSEILAMGAPTEPGGAADPTKFLDSDKDAYFYTFENIPITDKAGNYYTYWIKEIDGAQDGSNDKVFTLYSPAQIDAEIESADLGSVTVAQHDIPLTSSDIGADDPKETYVENVFKAKKINVRKYWLDNNNEDGLRPSSLNITITESNTNAENDPDAITVNFDRVLSKESSSDPLGWNLQAALARYYFNGTEAVENLYYKISEAMPDGQNYTLITEDMLAQGEDSLIVGDSSDPVSYTVSDNSAQNPDAPFSDVNFQSIGSLDTLNLTNYKKPQKGELSLEKTFNALDEKFKADTRPAELYFKLMRTNDDIVLNGAYYTDQKLTVELVTPSAEEGGQDTVVNITSDVIRDNGLITVPRDNTATDAQGNLKYTYPKVVVNGLPIGSSTDGDVQVNGTFTANRYKYVECDSGGVLYDSNNTNYESFPYTWTGSEKGTSSETARLDSKSKQYKNDYEITNTLKTENHTVKKKWNDDANNNIPNYYKTRTTEFHVRLERSLAPTDPNPVWETVPGYENLKLDTDEESMEYEDYSSYFTNLPKYDSEGHKYYYRVIETYIGSDDTDSYGDKYETDKEYHITIGGVTYTYPATNVYYVDYDNPPADESVDPSLTPEQIAEQRLTDKTTWIDNHLIRKTDYQNFIVDKDWSDNLNQDGKRVPITVVLKQYIELTNHQEVVKQRMPVVLNEENNWHYEWTNYPLQDEDGNPYHYDVYEDSDVEGYSQQISDIIRSDVQSGVDSYEMRSVTNTHNQELGSLSVDKSWLNEQTRDKNLRPESIEFVLYCQYTAYKYVNSDDPTTALTTDADIAAASAAGKLQIVEDTAKSYDGPVNYNGQSAAQLLHYYPDTAKNNSYVPTDPGSQQYHYSQTLTPADKLNDDQWKDAIRFDNLPVYINTCATDRYNGREYAVQYYVKEVEPTLAPGTTNPYVYGSKRVDHNVGGEDITVLPYLAEGEGSSPATTLLNGSTPSDQTVIVSNKLKTREITVHKIWDDNGYDNSLHYDIDFTLTCTNATEGFEYSQTLTLGKNAKDSQDLPIYYVTFSNLPIYGKNGEVLTYDVTEKVHVDSGIAPDVKYGYIQSTPAEDREHGILYGYTITNTLPVVHLKADKTWRDHNNRDGQRPDELSFTLTGIAESATDINVSMTDGSSAYTESSSDTRWKVDLGIRPLYNENNVPYVYSVSEEAASGDSLKERGYVRYVDAAGSPGYLDKNNNYSITLDTGATPDEITDDPADSYGNAVKVFHFKNRYEPKTDNLKVTKVWDDTVGSTDFSGWARPANVEVTLCYQYGNGSVVRLADAGSDDPVKKLFANDYRFTRTIDVGSNWADVFDDLPLYVNPTGTQVFNGESYLIHYSVEETPINGYRTAYSPTYTLPGSAGSDAATYSGTALDGTDSVDEKLTVTNTLKTKTVKVKKQWEDGDYRGNQAKHYDVNLTLAKTNDSTKALTDTISCATADITAATTVTDAVIFTIPQYNADGSVANYTVTENTANDQQYGYVTSYSDNHVFDAAGTDAIADNAEITVYNTLPLTTVSVTKQWVDNTNQYTLRPETITLYLKRRPVTDNHTAWASADAGWTDYQVTISSDDTDVTDSGNTWNYTYSKLPRYDEHNIPYEYKAAEDQVNAYDTYYLQNDNTTYLHDVVTKNDSSFAVGTDSSLSFGVRNTLITEAVTLTKVWDDNDYPNNPDDLHYPVTFRVGNSGAAGLTFSSVDAVLDQNSSTTTVNHHTAWNETRTLPVYDTNGDPIQYVVTELDDTGHPHHYGYDQVTNAGDVRQAINAPASTAVVSGTAITQAGTHTGYATGYYDSYTIVNELPLTEITAVKHWNGDLEKYPNADAVVNVNLTCTPQYPGDTTLNTEKTIVYDGTDASDDSVIFDKLLVANYDNTVYTYTVSEQTVKGYSTDYDKQNITASASAATDRTVTITNTPLKSSAQFVKYDLTDLEKHGSHSNFSLITLPGAQFELYRKFTGKSDKKIEVRETVSGTTGAYTVVDAATEPVTVITSGADGRISLNNLEPNEYYLKEIAAPTGYQTKDNLDQDRIFEFTVSVSNANEISTTYVSKTLTKDSDTGELKLDNADFSADTAKTALTDLQAVISGSSAPVYGIPDEENMSRLTMTKVDSLNQTLPLPNATYYLLRLINYQYKKSGAEGSNAEQYLENALAVLDDDYGDSSAIWTYWEKVGQPYYTTGADGKISVEGHMFGTYVFYEVKAPVGYERDYSHDGSLTSIGPVELDSGNAVHETEIHDLTHLEPHKTAEVKILKTDENGNPLKDAVFELYKVKTGEETADTLVTTVTTGYDGMNPTAIPLDPEHYNWGQQFYFIEKTPPKGYDADNEDDGLAGRTKISFTLTPELADETLHIVRANDVRLKGKVNLTKTSAASTSTINTGDPLADAVYKLCKKDGSSVSLYQHTTTPSLYRAVSANDIATDITAAGFAYSTTVTTMKTYSDGKLHIEGLDWGDYYLEETGAPTGFELPAETEDRRVYFSVGRNNCGDTPQELLMTNEPLTAQLEIYKHIDAFKLDAWGEPTFIFKVQQTAYYDYDAKTFVDIPAASQPVLTKTITPITPVDGGTGYEGATGAFELEPGTYTVTEVRVARYSAAAVSETVEKSTGKVSGTSNDLYIASFSILPGGEAEVKFDNKLKNYEKLSHVDKKTNRFNGYKALEVGDKDGLTPVHQSGVLYSVTVQKSDLNPVLIKSDGTRVPITDLSKLAITDLVMSDGTTKPIASLSAAADEITVTDNGTSITVTGRLEDIAGSIYRLRAEYNDTFIDDFELRFAVNSLFVKSEKTVSFRNDTANMSYYSDNGENGVYNLIFIMENPNIIKKILHNGTAVTAVGTASFPEVFVDRNFSGQYRFDHWTYTCAEDNITTPVSATDAQLLDYIIRAPDNAQIIVTAVLSPVSGASP